MLASSFSCAIGNEVSRRLSMLPTATVRERRRRPTAARRRRTRAIQRSVPMRPLSSISLRCRRRSCSMICVRSPEQLPHISRVSCRKNDPKDTTMLSSSSSLFLSCLRVFLSLKKCEYKTHNYHRVIIAIVRCFSLLCVCDRSVSVTQHLCCSTMFL